MASNFGTNFLDEYSTHLKTGAASALSGQKNRLSVEEEMRKRQEKVAKKNKQTEGYAELTGLPLETDPFTGEKTIGAAPEDYSLPEFDQARYAQLFPEIGNEYQQAFTGLQKANDTSPDYVGIKSQWNPETKQGEVVGFNKNTNEKTVIAVDPTYKPKKVMSDIIEGVVDVDGEKFGKAGRRTRLMIFEDGTHKQIDLGIKSKTGDKTTDTLEFELGIADLSERVDNVRTKRNTYVSGKFADEQAREAYVTGMRSDLNELALEFAKLGSQTAQKEVLEIFNQGKILIGNPVGAMRLSHKDYYERERDRINDEYIAGEWGYEDATAIQQFLSTKYELYIPYEDSKREEDEFDFDSILNETQLEKK